MYLEHRNGGSEYRNLSPRECFWHMEFEENDYEILVEKDNLVRKNMTLYSRERLERLAGNSIVVEVLKAIFGQVDELQSILSTLNTQHQQKSPTESSKKAKQKTKKIPT